MSGRNFNYIERLNMLALVIFSCLILASTANQELWREFKETHGVSYTSAKEEALRFGIFQDNLRRIEEHNVRYDRGEVSYFLKITQFADLTDQEFSERMLTLKPPSDYNGFEKYVRDPTLQVPDSIDWRESNCFTDVVNQGQCGSCWTFSTTGALESHYCLKYGILYDLSEQNLLDCTNSYGNFGCKGGWAEHSFQYVKENGIESESDYPYEGVQNSCRYDASKKTKVTVTGYVEVTPGEIGLKDAVGTVGPVSTYMNATSLGLYGGGIFDNPDCPITVNHAIVSVGYGTDAGVDYWIVRNSWGNTWGDNGYFKLVRNKYMCGFGNSSYYPLVE